MNALWKLSHKLYGAGRIFRPLARFTEMLQQTVCSNAVSSKCEIGSGTVFFHHGLGCTVHFNATIGSNCKIFSNVTIGDQWSGVVRTEAAPTIGNHVMIGAGAVILGSIKVGDNSIIGANAVVTKDVPAGSLVVGANKIMEGN